MPKGSRRRFSQEFKDEAVRMVLDGPRTIAEVAREFGVHDTTLGNWVNTYKRTRAEEEPHSLSGPERARLRELERENSELREKLSFLKKSRGLLRGREQSVTAKFELIDAEKANHKIVKMCDWLEVSRSGYYEWRDRPASATAQRRDLLQDLIAGIFYEHEEVYGYRRVHAELPRRGERCSAEPVRVLMRELGLLPAQVRPFTPKLTEQGAFRGIPDLVRRDFTAVRPGVKLVGDITYIPTWEGFCHLATVIDCYSKAVVGWAMADHYRTELITEAIENAVQTFTIEKDAIFHSDRGSNYTSDEFGAVLKRLDVRRSVGRTGICYDKAMAESFFSALKNEWLKRYVFAGRAKVRRAVIRYIESFCNRRRLHSSVGYRTPFEVLDEYTALQPVA
ncbi:IS3 family transposase [Streptosporangium sp. NPDC002607]